MTKTPSWGFCCFGVDPAPILPFQNTAKHNLKSIVPISCGTVPEQGSRNAGCAAGYNNRKIGAGLTSHNLSDTIPKGGKNDRH